MRIGGHRNYGYGKRMGWAGKNALADRYGRGHYATRAAHAERWGRFVAFARETASVRDARHVVADPIDPSGWSASTSRARIPTLSVSVVVVAVVLHRYTSVVGKSSGGTARGGAASGRAASAESGRGLGAKAQSFTK